jgi:hypothetical protein
MSLRGLYDQRPTEASFFHSGSTGHHMRKLTDHVVNPCNDQIVIEVLDEPGAGGACHRYATHWPICSGGRDGVYLSFQDGPIATVGTNGITHEVLLAIIADRLRSFQAGPYACRENALALTKIEEAMHWLQARTVARMRRGVEGTHTV